MSRVLIACEESQAVTIAMRNIGVEAHSCDIEPCSGGHPKWHIQGDVTPLLQEDWGMIIAFPPCTNLCVSGARWFKKKRADGRQQQGIEFFLNFTRLKCPRVAIENPAGIMGSRYRSCDQIIQPWQFGHEEEKQTCLWLKGLPLLHPTNIVTPANRVSFDSGKSMPEWYAKLWSLSPKERAAARSKTFSGIADAMAAQWGPLVGQPIGADCILEQGRLFGDE